MNATHESPAVFGAEFLVEVPEPVYGCFGCGDEHTNFPKIVPWEKPLE